MSRKRRICVGLFDASQMPAGPRLPAIDFNFINLLAHAAFVQHWNRQPGRAICGLDAITITPAVLIELYVVIKYKDVAAVQLIEKAEPGQIARLQYRQCRQRTWTPLQAEINGIRDAQMTS